MERRIRRLGSEKATVQKELDALCGQHDELAGAPQALARAEHRAELARARVSRFALLAAQVGEMARARTTLAGIGMVESHHGTYHDAQILPNGDVTPPIRGVRLDGSNGFVIAGGAGVLVLEPVVWKDGTGGYRSEEIIVITEEGWIKLTDYPYSPYGD